MVAAIAVYQAATFSITDKKKTIFQLQFYRFKIVQNYFNNQNLVLKEP